MITTTKPKEITSIFKQGGIFAYPTEAVYGLGCDPENQETVLRLLAIKNRPINKGLILVASNISQVEKYLKPLSKLQRLCTKPSKTTYIYPALSSAPKWLTGDFDSLAVRISQHPIVRDLCESFDSALVSTSANVSGQEPAKTAKEVSEQFADQLDAIIDGNIGDLLTPTAIRDSISGEIIRS